MLGKVKYFGYIIFVLFCNWGSGGVLISFLRHLLVYVITKQLTASGLSLVTKHSSELMGFYI